MRWFVMLLAVAVCSWGASVQAEGKGGGCDKDGDKGKNYKEHFEKMAKELGLDQAQKDKIKTIHEQFRAKMQKAEGKDAKKAVRDEMFKAIKEVLTPEQRTKFTERRQKCQQERSGKGCEDKGEKCGKGNKKGQGGKCGRGNKKGQGGKCGKGGKGKKGGCKDCDS